MEVRPGRATGHADKAEAVAAHDVLPFLHVDPAEVEERRHEPMAVIEHDEVAFEQQWSVGEPDNAACGRGHRGAGWRGDVDAEVRGLWDAAEDALRPINAADPPVGGPGERLGPAQSATVPGAGG